MKVLVVGNGGREHALVWKISRSPLVQKVYCAPGNGGTAALAENVALPGEMAGAVEFLVDFVKSQGIDLTIVGPEAFLAAGLTDRLRAEGRLVFGPSRLAARVETSKSFAKSLMTRAGIPTAAYAEFSDLEAALGYARSHALPMVIKADGLAAGKGVVVATTVEEAIAAVKAMLGEGRFGDAGRKLVIEDFLDGEEASVLALTDGTDVLVLPPAQDHKRAGEGDTGPNTGGMGAYAPAPLVTPEILTEVKERILIPAIREMAALGCPFRGVLYAGLMITSNGPKVVEFNARFGDPETQVILPLIQDDIVPALAGVARDSLRGVELRFADAAAAAVVVAASGYPQEYRTGQEIDGIANAEKIPGVIVFHAGTREEQGRIVSAGGRVLNVVATEKDIQAAVERAYRGVDSIDFPGGYYRRDIAHRVLRAR